jgi:hypothetical protein
MVKMQHPRHGFTFAYGDQESLEKQGWSVCVEAPKEKDAPAVLQELKAEAVKQLSAEITDDVIWAAAKRKPGRPAKAK